jgi:predicted lipid-binding transport protein (Tim44 family)
MRLSRLLAVLCAGAFVVALVASAADARTGRGGSMGSRGGNTFSAPPSTNTAPSGGSTINRSVTQPSNPGTNVARPGTQQPAGGGMFNRPGGLFGGGLLGGLAMGFLGAGLFGLLMGNGFLGGLGGLASIFGLLFQVALVGGIVYFAWSWWQRRQQPSPALAQANGPQPSYREMFASGGGTGAAPPVGGGRSAEPSDDIGINPADYDAFEKLLGDIQAAYSNEDISALRSHATPEMVSYFAEDLADNTSRGVVNRISDVKLLQGDLAEAWREGGNEYATVAMRFSLVDQLVERASGRVVEGDGKPQEVVEVWTFLRGRGGNWILSAIQQA